MAAIGNDVQSFVTRVELGEFTTDELHLINQALQDRAEAVLTEIRRIVRNAPELVTSTLEDVLFADWVTVTEDGVEFGRQGVGSYPNDLIVLNHDWLVETDIRGRLIAEAEKGE